MAAPVGRDGHLPWCGNRTEPEHPRCDGTADGVEHVAQGAAGRVEAVSHRVEAAGGDGGVAAHGVAVGGRGAA